MPPRFLPSSPRMSMIGMPPSAIPIFLHANACGPPQDQALTVGKAGGHKAVSCLNRFARPTMPFLKLRHGPRSAVLACAIGFVAVLAHVAPAKADLRLCN